jgi:hypothetical protein
MTDQKKMDELRQRYMRAAHAMQTATAFQIENLGDFKAGSDHKHLRVGVNSSMADTNALGALLIGKGLITELEYMEAITLGMEQEAERVAVDTRKQCNLPDTVTFG